MRNDVHDLGGTSFFLERLKWFLFWLHARNIQTKAGFIHICTFNNLNE